MPQLGMVASKISPNNGWRRQPSAAALFLGVVLPAWRECVMAAPYLDRAARKSPTIHRVVPPSRMGAGSNPALTLRQAVALLMLNKPHTT